MHGHVCVCAAAEYFSLFFFFLLKSETCLTTTQGRQETDVQSVRRAASKILKFAEERAGLCCTSVQYEMQGKA